MWLILLFKSNNLNFKIVMKKKTIKLVLEIFKYLCGALLGYLGSGIV